MAVKDIKEPVKKNLKYERDKDRQMVKGIFKYYEVPGGSVSFPFKAYKEDPVETYHLVDGEVYTLPLGVAKHLANNCWYPVHKHTLDEKGKRVTTVGRKVHRMGFHSLEFTDIDELSHSGPTEIVTVEYSTK